MPRVAEAGAATRPAAKRAVNVSVRQDLITEAKEFGTNISAVLERALEAEHREHKRRQWRQENAAAIQTLNLWVEENGVPFADLRPW